VRTSTTLRHDRHVETVQVGSHETKLGLVCVDRLGDGAAELIRARIVAPGLEAERDAYEYDGCGALAAFFEGMADSWRGWSGKRAFESLEGDLDLAAAHDGRHVTLSVRLQQDGPGDWKASAKVIIDPGEDLAAAARSVRGLVGRSNARRSPRD
jgi:Family of unknown function (DUF6228)